MLVLVLVLVLVLGPGLGLVLGPLGLVLGPLGLGRGEGERFGLGGAALASDGIERALGGGEEVAERRLVLAGRFRPLGADIVHPELDVVVVVVLRGGRGVRAERVARGVELVVHVGIDSRAVVAGLPARGSNHREQTVIAGNVVERRHVARATRGRGDGVRRSASCGASEDGQTSQNRGCRGPIQIFASGGRGPARIPDCAPCENRNRWGGGELGARVAPGCTIDADETRR